MVHDRMSFVLCVHVLVQLTVSASPGECAVCYLPIEDSAHSDLQATCNHRFCRDCWLQHFVARLDAGVIRKS